MQTLLVVTNVFRSIPEDSGGHPEAKAPMGYDTRIFILMVACKQRYAWIR